MNIISRSPPSPSSVNGAVPAELDAITARALAKDLEHRFQSAASFSSQLRSIAPALDVRSPEPSGDYLMPVDDDADKVPLMVWVSGVGGVAVLGAALWWGFRS